MADLPTRAEPLKEVEILYFERRPRQLEVIDFLEFISHLMDRCFEVPGTRLRFGINSLLLLVPFLGDVVASMISLFIISVGLHHYRVPRIVAARMVLNTLLDATLSGIPILGNLWDVSFKADSRNVRLLREYAGQGEERPSTWRHWLFVGAVLLGFLGLLVLLVLGAITLIAAIARALENPGG